MRGVREIIQELKSRQQPITTKDVAERAGVSRQAAQKQLKALVSRGELTVEGKARAARYHPRDPGPDLWAKVKALAAALEAPPTALQPQARMSRAQRVEVASAGSLFRLSARILLQDVECDELVLDFTGVEDLGDEFVEEIFVEWASAHPATRLRVENLDARLGERFPALTAG